MGLLSRDQILTADDRPVREVPVPEWGGSVLVQGMNGTGRDEFLASMTVIRAPGAAPVWDSGNATAKLVARCIIDPATREPMFTQRDVAALGAKSAAALWRVAGVAETLSGLTEEAMDELGKDTPPTPNGNSTSAPPPPPAEPSLNSSPPPAASS